MSAPPRPRLTSEGRRAAGVFVWLAWTVAAIARYLDGADLQAAGFAALGVVTAVGLVALGDRRARARGEPGWTPGSRDKDKDTNKDESGEDGSSER
jgi:uncharacterized membrane protein YedE/YeeE